MPSAAPVRISPVEDSDISGEPFATTGLIDATPDPRMTHASSLHMIILRKGRPQVPVTAGHCTDVSRPNIDRSRL
jgi:hypothetical protein